MSTINFSEKSGIRHIYYMERLFENYNRYFILIINDGATYLETLLLTDKALIVRFLL